MGYSTYFTGSMLVDPPLSAEHIEILTTFNYTDHREEPGMPGIWCGWIPSPDGTMIEHDGGKKFYDYAEWLQYLVDRFLLPWGYRIAGAIEWNGEESGDLGRLVIDSPLGTVKVQYAHITYR